MKCTTVRTKLAGYLDDALTGAARSEDRGQIHKHLEACLVCREELERFRKLAVLLSRVPKTLPPIDLAIRIKVAAAKMQQAQDSGRWRRLRDRAEILLDNVFRPLTVPATGGVFSAILVFVLVLQMIAPGITVSAVQNDVQLNLMLPAAVDYLTLSGHPQTGTSEPGSGGLPNGLLVDVTVDAQGQMIGYDILAGPDTDDLRHKLDQILLFSHFKPMKSFGRNVPGGHVILSFVS